MAQSAPVHKGSNESKADGALGTSSLAVNNAEIAGGKLVNVAVIFWSTAGNPTVKWGNKLLRRDKTNEFGVGGFRVQLYKAYVRTTRTRDAVCTWGTQTPGARAMIVFETNEASVEDVSVVNDNTNSTTPNTSSAGDSTVANTVSIAAFGANGPSTDAAGTINLGHTQLARVGTSGGVDTDNLTLTVTYEILTAIGVVRSSMSVTTARDWANLIVAYKASDTYTVSRAYYRSFDGHPTHEAVVFVMKDGTGTEKYETIIQREEFENMTDQEVTDRITNDATWWANKEEGLAPSPDFNPDSTFDTRVASFVDDTVTV